MDSVFKSFKKSLGRGWESVVSTSDAWKSQKNNTKSGVVESPSWAGYYIPLQHHLVYEKMEQLLERMGSENGGIKSISYKNKSGKTLISMFTGSDLVSWIKQNTDVSDEDEALFLSNKLYIHGYVVSMNDHKSCISDLKNNGFLYSFQDYQYFPSQWPNPVDREYAVYLCQRALRNISRLELSECEANTLASFKNTLDSKWTIILTESTAQVIASSKKPCNNERKLSDYQKRTFWNVHRPMPGVVNTTEIDYTKLNKYLKVEFPKKQKANIITSEPNVNEPTTESLIEDISNLQLALNEIQRNLDAPKKSEWYIKYYERHAIYDTILHGQDPSSPWSLTHSKEWPNPNEITKFRVQKWSYEIKILLADTAGKEHFNIFLEKEFSDENLRFLEAVKDYKSLSINQLPGAAKKIWQDYFDSEILNVDSQTKNLCKFDVDNNICNHWTFDIVANQIYQLLKNDCYPRYIRSEFYKEYLNNVPKKKTATWGVKALLSSVKKRHN